MGPKRRVKKGKTPEDGSAAAAAAAAAAAVAKPRKSKRAKKAPSDNSKNILINMITNDAWARILSFLEFDYNSKPRFPLLHTCRQFSKLFDWAFVLKHICCVPTMPFVKNLQFLYKAQTTEEGKQRIIDSLSGNASCDETFLNILLLMGVKLNDIYWVKKLLAKDSCGVEGALDKALIHDRNEIAEILRKDLRVKKQIKLCHDCRENPGCVTCMHWSDGDCQSKFVDNDSDEDEDEDEDEDSGGPHKYCKDCDGDCICVICAEYECSHCRGESDDDEETLRYYHKCSTCQKTACEYDETYVVKKPCSQKCANFRVCGNVQCRKCALDKGGVAWYKCSLKKNAHVFCDACNPNNVQYALDDDDGNEDGNDCPACRDENIRECYVVSNRSGRFSGVTCELRAELNTVAGMDEWYRCPRNPEHMFCGNCNPKLCGKGKQRKKCPACGQK